MRRSAARSPSAAWPSERRPGRPNSASTTTPCPARSGPAAGGGGGVGARGGGGGGGGSHRRDPRRGPEGGGVMTGLVLVEPRDGVLTITVNRPQEKNAVDHEAAVQLAAALDRLDADPDVSVGVLTGAGGTFCAGMDLKAFARGEVPVLDGRGFGGLTRARAPHPPI